MNKESMRDTQDMHDLMAEWHEQRGRQGPRMAELIGVFIKMWSSGGYEGNQINEFRRIAVDLLGKPSADFVVPYKIEYLARCAFFYRSHGMLRASGKVKVSGFRLVEDQEIDASRDLDILMLEHALAQVWLHRQEASIDSFGGKIREMCRWREQLNSLKEIGGLIVINHALRLSTARHVLASQAKPSDAGKALSIFEEESRRGGNREEAVARTAKRMNCSIAKAERYLDQGRYGIP